MYKRYFWRTYDGNVINLIEEKASDLGGYELKWSHKSAKKSKHFPWLASYQVITKENLKDFVF